MQGYMVKICSLLSVGRSHGFLPRQSEVVGPSGCEACGKCSLIEYSTTLIKKNHKTTYLFILCKDYRDLRLNQLLRRSCREDETVFLSKDERVQAKVYR